MNARGILSASERWYRLLLRLYPGDFRDEMGTGFVETYLDRTRTAIPRGRMSVATVWLRAFADSLWNGFGERLRPSVAWRRAGNWGRDTELAVRRLVRAPVFTLSMVGTLVVGLGAFAVVFTVIDKVLIEPLPYARPNDLYYVWRDYTSFFDLKRGWLGGPDVTRLDSAGGPIMAAAGLRNDRRTLADASGADARPEEIRVMVSTANLFDLLGTHPLMGRGFAQGEEGEGRAGVAVLAYELWQRRFGSDRAVIGRTVRLNGEVFTVIGIMPRDFHFVRHASEGAPEAADAYITFAYMLGSRSPGQGSFAGLIRARPGSTPAAVASAVTRVGRTIDESFFKHRGLKLYPVALTNDLVSNIRPALTILGLSAAFLVLVLGANLAALLLTRAVHRSREFAVSRALGANPVALVRATLLEAGLLGTAGGIGGAIAAAWGTRLLVALAPADLPQREAITVDWKVAAIVVGVGAMLGVAAGIAPAFWATRASLSALLRNAALRGGGATHLRRSLVVVQVALCLVLLSTGGLVARSFAALLQSHPGFDPSGVLTMRVPIAPWAYPDNASAVAMHDRLQRAFEAMPGVESVGAASAVPLTANTDQTDVRFPGAPGNTGQTEHDSPLADVISARKGWFATLGIRMLSGRDFEPRRAGGRREVIIDRTLAERFFPGGGAAGTRIIYGEDSLIVVGVVDHARQYDLHKDGRPQVYIRDEDDTYGALYFAIRTQRDPADLVPDVRAIVHTLDPQLALSEMRPLQEVVNESLREQRASTVLIAGFSFGALLLAAMGLFGVVAGAVARRKHEIAVRLALGADRGRVLRLVVGEGTLLVVTGVVIAAPGIYMAGRLLRGMLIGISPFDPVTISSVVLGLGVVTLLACYFPARRVSAIDPAHALREQ